MRKWRLDPRLAGRFNLAVDVAAVWSALAVGGWLAGDTLLPWRAALATAVWLGMAAALRYYDGSSVRLPLEDAALSLVLTAATALSLELSELFSRPGPRSPPSRCRWSGRSPPSCAWWPAGWGSARRNRC
ncbi:MAG: hypothetical protein QM765_09325 [Myxococcales bacterium]